jgi:hypothetical protein
VKTRAEIEAALEALGWRLTNGPRQTSAGWRATIERGNESLLLTTFAPTEMVVLDDLLKRARARAPWGA